MTGPLAACYVPMMDRSVVSVRSRLLTLLARSHRLLFDHPSTPIVLAGGYLPIRNALEGRPVPAHTRTLAPHQPPLVIARPDGRTLAVRPKGGFLKSPWDQLGRGLNHSMTLGDRVELTGMTAVVTALTDDLRPAEVAFRFDVPLEDPSLLWLCWTGRKYEPFIPPIVGQSVTLPTRK